MYELVDTHAHLEEVEDLVQALKRAEKVYGFTQRLESKVPKPLPEGQEALSKYL